MVEEFRKGKAQAVSSSSEEEIGIGGFKLFARVNQSTQYKAQVPNFVLEDGSYANDHIINDPLVLSINGEIGGNFAKTVKTSYEPEPVQKPSLTQQFYKPMRTASQLTGISYMNKGMSNALSKLNNFKSVSNQIFNTFKSNTQNPRAVTSADTSTIEKDNQEEFLIFLESVYYAKLLVDVEMPYKKHTDMAITDLSIERDNTNNSVKFTASFKKVQFAQIVYTSASKYFKKPADGATKKKTESAKDKGSQKPEDNKKSNKSLLKTLGGGK